MENRKLEKFIYTTQEVADLLNMKVTSITRMIRNEEIEAQKIAKAYHIPRREVERLMMFSSRDSAGNQFQIKRDLELENEVLKQQLEFLKNILKSANSVLGME